MVEIPYIYIPITGLCCYAFLLVAMMAAKKNKVIHSFIYLLICYALWTGGSMLMRLQIFPGYKFWYNVSLLSLFTTPLLLYIFVQNFVETKGYFLKYIWFVLTFITLVLTYFEVFLKVPVFINLGNGQGIYQYTMEWPVIIPTLVFLIIIISTAMLVIQAIRLQGIAAPGVTPIIIGMGFLFIGNLLSILPGNIFPYDTLAGIFNAAFLFYALYKKRLFKLTLLVSRTTILAVSIIVVYTFFAFEIKWLENTVISETPDLARYSTLIISLLFAMVTLLFYRLISKVIDNLFIKDEQVQAQKLKEFSTAISKSLDLNEIMDLLMQLVSDVVKVEKPCVYLLDEEGKNYKMAASGSPLDIKSYSFAASNPCINWLNNNNSCLLLKDFKKTTMYKALWDAEKKQLDDLNVKCIVPLKCDDELVGILVLSQKVKNGNYTVKDIDFLESAQSIVSIAIKNANLYQKAYYESRIDDLTGLLNRKFFYETINKEFEKNRVGSLALIIINLDDFKLYNQLYGNREGDAALHNTANIILTSLGRDGFAARYSGKEFAIVMPGCDTLKAVNLANNIRQQIIDMNKNNDLETLKVLTASCGICVYPYAASNITELISNADMAVYNAKRSGKNKVLAYSLDKPKSEQVVTVQDIPKRGYDDYASTIFALTAAIDAKDHYTFSHSQNVAKYATALATAIGLNKDHVRMIYEAALLHDIGKIGIPEYILSKPSKLTEEEYLIMQKHVENSISIIRHLPSLDYVIPAAIGHHERWDGKGYPRGISGEDIPIAARCLAIADTFDAMTSNRMYRKALPVETAIEEIDRMAGTQFDPKLAPVFTDLVRQGKIKVEHAPVQTEAETGNIA